MIFRILVSFCLLFAFYFPAASSIVGNTSIEKAGIWADSIYPTLRLEDKLALILLGQPGFTVVDPLAIEHLDIKPSSFTRAIVDIRGGFEMGSMPMPFPDEKTLLVCSPESRDGMIRWLADTFARSGVNCFLSDIVPLPSINVANGDEHPGALAMSSLWIPFRPDAYSLNAFYAETCLVPSHINSLLPSSLPVINLPQVGDEKGISMVAGAALSVRQVLEDGKLLITNDYTKDYERLLNAFRDRWLDEDILVHSCRNALIMKYLSTETHYFFSPKLSEKELLLTFRRVYESSVSLFQPHYKKLFPFTQLDMKVGYYTKGMLHGNNFVRMADNYIRQQPMLLHPFRYDLIFLLSDPSYYQSVPLEEVIKSIRIYYPGTSLVLVWAGDPGNLPFSAWPSGLDGMVLAPSANPFVWEIMAQVVFNGVATSPKAPREVYGYLASMAIHCDVTRLKYGLPEEVGLSSDTLALIDKIVEKAIKQNATPGAQVLVARNGVVVLHRSYGWHNYKKKRLVKNSDIYDLASVTKIAGTMPVVMRTYDDGLWALNDPISTYLPEADTTDKRDITVRQLLLHQSGLQASIPFHTEILDKSMLKGDLYSKKRSSTHPYKVDNNLYMNKNLVYKDYLISNRKDSLFSVTVAENVYLNHNYVDSMYYLVLASKLRKPTYLYSDLNFILLKRIIENVSGMSMENAASELFYSKIGSASLMFNPWKYGFAVMAAPTEDDQTFRKQTLQGYVHDQTAALMGGVAGHAGLFGNANDLAKLLQMYLNKGEYGGYRYLGAGTVEFFTSAHEPGNRRGLGFDKPEMDPKKDTPVSRLASAESYGHQGFSGTMVWVDPRYNLIYIFLSNRIHPDSYNRKLSTLNIRTDIQDVIYRSITKP